MFSEGDFVEVNSASGKKYYGQVTLKLLHNSNVEVCECGELIHESNKSITLCKAGSWEMLKTLMRMKLFTPNCKNPACKKLQVI